MFGWIKRWAQLAALRGATADVDRLLDTLRGYSDEDMGFYVAMAAHCRNALEQLHGWNLLDPARILNLDPWASSKVTGTINTLQRDRLLVEAAGMMVWSASLRCFMFPELRHKGQSIWGEMRRGFPHAELAADVAAMQTGFVLNCCGFDSIPIGLEPR